MSVSFLDDIQALPADAPANHPHIIDLDTYTASNDSNVLHAWDAVVTMLLALEKSTLMKFLNESKEEFKLGISPNGSDERIVVWRKGTDVLVGHFTYLPDTELFEWEHVIRGTISANGAWTLEHASYGLYTKCEWESVWKGDFTKEAPNRGHVSETQESMQNKASVLAETIMEWRPWAKKKYNWTVLFDCD